MLLVIDFRCKVMAFFLISLFSMFHIRYFLLKSAGVSILLRNFAHNIIKTNSMKILFVVISMLVWLVALTASAQGPNNSGTYYQKADGKKGAELKTALYQILKDPNVMHYDSLWTAYRTSDARQQGDSLIIWDMYSNISAYPIDSKLHGNGGEGIKGFQREHSMPKSWFNPTDRNNSGSLTYNDIKPMYSDLVHVIPTDGTVNNKRSNNAYGEVHDPALVDWTSANGFSKQSKKGGCTVGGWKDEVTDYKKKRVFEPNDEYKGDLARIYFYMVTCYEPLTARWSGDMFNEEDSTDVYQPFANWAFNMLMQWAKDDPVSEKEIARNEVVYQMQGNRNPFVDYPGLEDYVWGEKKEEPICYGGEKPGEIATAVSTDIELNDSVFGVDWSENNNFRNYFSRIPLIVEKDGITVTFAYGIEGSKMYCDSTQIRLYNKNVLIFRANNADITSIEFTVPEKAEDKELIPVVGRMEGNTWVGQAHEVLFTSTYTNSWPETNANKHIQISKVPIKVKEPERPDGINDFVGQSQPSSVDAVFTLSGIRVSDKALRPDIYIKNGKKFVTQ